MVALEGKEQKLPYELLLGCALGWAGVLMVGQSWNFLYADDALPFVVRVFQGQTHPHHLILGVLAGLNAMIGWREPPQFVWTLGLVRAYVVLMSILGLVGLGYLAWRWFQTRWAVGVAVLVTAGSYGYWSYSVVPDFYVPGIAAVIGAAIALEHFQVTGQRWWLAGVVGCVWLAAMNHQSYAVFAVIAASVLLHAKQHRSATFFLASSLLLLGATYVSAFLLQHEYQSLWHFVLGYASHMQFTPYDHLQWLTPLYALVGIVRAWTFPEYFLRLDPVASWAQERWRMKLFLDERFLLRGIDPFLAVLLGVLGILATLFLVGLALREVGKRREQFRGRWSFSALLGWACVLGVVAVFWEPSSNEFWLWMPPVGALLVAGVRDRWRWAVAGAGGALVLTTAPVIWLYRSPDNDIYSVNKQYRERLSSDDVLLTADFHQVRALNWLYPTRARVLEFELGRLEWEDRRLQQVLWELARPEARGRLVLDPLIVMPHPSESALRMKLPRYTEAHVEGVLQRIAAFCQAEAVGTEPRRRVPLLGVWRDGGGVVEFQRRQLPGMQWVQ